MANSNMSISVHDEISPFVQYMLTDSNWLRKAGKSLGWFVQKQTKGAIQKGGPTGTTWQEKSPNTLRKKLSWLGKEYRGSPSRKWFGKMNQAVAYKYSDGTVKIGWASKAAKMRGDVLEKGQTQTATARMKRFFAGAAKVIPSEINLPPRPLWEPEFAVVRPHIVEYIDKKMHQYIEKGTDFGKVNSRRRKYEVY